MFTLFGPHILGVHASNTSLRGRLQISINEESGKVSSISSNATREPILKFLPSRGKIPDDESYPTEFAFIKGKPNRLLLRLWDDTKKTWGYKELNTINKATAKKINNNLTIKNFSDIDEKEHKKFFPKYSLDDIDALRAGPANKFTEKGQKKSQDKKYGAAIEKARKFTGPSTAAVAPAAPKPAGSVDDAQPAYVSLESIFHTNYPDFNSPMEASAVSFCGRNAFTIAVQNKKISNFTNYVGWKNPMIGYPSMGREDEAESRKNFISEESESNLHLQLHQWRMVDNTDPKQAFVRFWEPKTNTWRYKEFDASKQAGTGSDTKWLVDVPKDKVPEVEVFFPTYSKKLLQDIINDPQGKAGQHSVVVARTKAFARPLIGASLDAAPVPAPVETSSLTSPDAHPIPATTVRRPYVTTEVTEVDVLANANLDALKTTHFEWCSGQDPHILGGGNKAAMQKDYNNNSFHEITANHSSARFYISKKPADTKTLRPNLNHEKKGKRTVTSFNDVGDAANMKKLAEVYVLQLEQSLKTKFGVAEDADLTPEQKKSITVNVKGRSANYRVALQNILEKHGFSSCDVTHARHQGRKPVSTGSSDAAARKLRDAVSPSSDESHKASGLSSSSSVLMEEDDEDDFSPSL